MLGQEHRMKWCGIDLRPKPFYLSYCLFFLVVLSGCASLPKVENWIHDLSSGDEPPQIVGVRRLLNPRESRAIVEHLKRQVGPTDILQRQITPMESISGSPLIAGNKVTLLVDGPDTYAAMTKAIEDARDHINLETYLFEADEVGQRFADLLLRKQTEWIQVNLIYDSVGSYSTPGAFFRELQERGIRVLEFNPINPLGLLNPRDHRKILVVDGKVAFTGGVNISAAYSKGSFAREEVDEAIQAWRDTHVQIEGPAVAEFQKLFLDTWARENAPELPTRNYFPALNAGGKGLVEVVGSTPEQRNRVVYLMYVSAIMLAGNSVHLTNAYFVPDSQMLGALKEASGRGVDVRVVLPGSSDIEATFYAGRSYYTDLLESGVKLYERRGGILHAKTAVIDSVWSTVGSTNLNLWSFMRNDEVNAVILDKDFANEMEALFQEDLKESIQIELEEWRKRPFKERFKEWFFSLFKYWL